MLPTISSHSETNLEITEPYLWIQQGKSENMVDERLGLSCCRRDAENLERIEQWVKLTLASNSLLTCVKTSFVNLPHSVSSKPLSKLNSPLLPFRQLPVIFSSSIVCTFCTCILILGPLGVLAAHKYKSSCRRASKYKVLLQLFRSASSGRRWSWDFESSLESWNEASAN